MCKVYLVVQALFLVSQVISLSGCSDVLGADPFLFIHPNQAASSSLDFTHIRTACIGDSITRAGAATNGGYCRLINSTFNTTNFGENRHKVGDVYGTTLNKATGRNFTCSIIMIGTNDRNSDMRAFRTSLNGVVDRLQADGQTVFLLTIPPANASGVAKVNAAIKEVARRHKVQLIDINAALGGTYNSSYYTDNLHLNDQGHAVIADLILKAAR